MPALAIMVILLIYPLFRNLFLSFFSFSVLFPDYQFVALKHYTKLSRDPYFWKAVKITFLYTGVVVSAQFFIGMGIAFLLYRKIRGVRILRVLVLLPYLSSSAVTGLMWRILWDADFGPINQVMRYMGIRGPAWIGSTSTAFWSLTVTETWRSMPFVALVLLAGLQALPRKPYEAAEMDGASRWQVFVHITLPLLKPIILIILLFQTIFTFRAFDIIWILTGGGPGGTTMTLSILIYRTLFRFWKGGASAAISVVMLAFTLIISSIYFRILYKEMKI